MSKKLQSRRAKGESASKRSASGGLTTGRRSSKEDYKIPFEAKKQILGLLIFLVGLLTALALISFSDKDQATIERLDSFFKIFRKETYSTLYITQNWLGIAGAITAGFLINNLFGYFTLLIPVILILIGSVIILKKDTGKILQCSVYLILLMFFLGSISGLLRIFYGTSISPFLSGTTGDFSATVFYQTLGSVGASIFFILGLAFTLVLLIDGNIFKTMARMKLLWEKIIDNFRKEKQNLKKKKDTNETEDFSVIDEAVYTDNDLKDLLRKEREKILKTKYSKELAEELLKGDLIKETMINRPAQENNLKDENEIQADGKVKTAKNPKSDSNKDKGAIPIITGEIKTGDGLKIANENDIDPMNSNEVDKLGDKREEDFEEEKLEEYKSPVFELLEEPSEEEVKDIITNEELTENGRLLQEKLLKFGIEVEKVFATPGPVVTLYELVPAADVKLSKIESLQDDIALAMKAKGIRMIIPIPGKGTVGVEIPNRKAQLVRIKSTLSSQKFNSTKKILPIAFGKTIDGDIFIDDLAKMPHLLIAGATGSGKSVGINTIIASLLYKMHPTNLKFVMIDPKKIELNLYSKLKKHFLATSTDINESIVTSPSNAVSILKSVEAEMEQRYDKLANGGVRNIEAYNHKYGEGNLKDNDFIRHRKMPYIVVIIDELADLMITAKREIEEPIARIAQMARAVGIHLIVATQRPSVDVITGVIKANFPVRIAYQVASKIDSRTILDMGGADALLRNGDMLYLSSSSPKPIRIQNAYISTEECEKVADYIEEQQGFRKPYLLPSIIEKRVAYGSIDDRDDLFNEAARLIFKLQTCSTSTLQRRLKLGFQRASRIIDQLEDAGIVGPQNGSKGREILIADENDLEEKLSY
jgi:DNA segregation ATPase FtsK/SpoIIIE, S-DNA-T family